MKVKVKKLNDNAVIPFKTYEKDFCYDVVAISEEQVAPNVWKYGIGLAFQIERGFEIFSKDENNPWNLCVYDLRTLQCNLSIDFRPRSSV